MHVHTCVCMCVVTSKVDVVEMCLFLQTLRIPLQCTVDDIVR